MRFRRRVAVKAQDDFLKKKSIITTAKQSECPLTFRNILLGLNEYQLEPTSLPQKLSHQHCPSRARNKIRRAEIIGKGTVKTRSKNGIALLTIDNLAQPCIETSQQLETILHEIVDKACQIKHFDWKILPTPLCRSAFTFPEMYLEDFIRRSVSQFATNRIPNNCPRQFHQKEKQKQTFLIPSVDSAQELMNTTTNHITQNILQNIEYKQPELELPATIMNLIKRPQTKDVSNSTRMLSVVASQRMEQFQLISKADEGMIKVQNRANISKMLSGARKFHPKLRFDDQQTEFSKTDQEKFWWSQKLDGFPSQNDEVFKNEFQEKKSLMCLTPPIIPSSLDELQIATRFFLRNSISSSCSQAAHFLSAKVTQMNRHLSKSKFGFKDRPSRRHYIGSLHLQTMTSNLFCETDIEASIPKIPSLWGRCSLESSTIPPFIPIPHHHMKLGEEKPQSSNEAQVLTKELAVFVSNHKKVYYETGPYQLTPIKAILTQNDYLISRVKEKNSEHIFEPTPTIPQNSIPKSCLLGIEIETISLFGNIDTMKDPGSRNGEIPQQKKQKRCDDTTSEQSTEIAEEICLSQHNQPLKREPVMTESKLVNLKEILSETNVTHNVEEEEEEFIYQPNILSTHTPKSLNVEFIEDSQQIPYDFAPKHAPISINEANESFDDEAVDNFLLGSTMIEDYIFLQRGEKETKLTKQTPKKLRVSLNMPFSNLPEPNTKTSSSPQLSDISIGRFTKTKLFEETVTPDSCSNAQTQTTSCIYVNSKFVEGKNKLGSVIINQLKAMNISCVDNEMNKHSQCIDFIVGEGSGVTVLSSSDCSDMTKVRSFTRKFINSALSFETLWLVIDLDESTKPNSASKISTNKSEVFEEVEGPRIVSRAVCNERLVTKNGIPEKTFSGVLAQLVRSVWHFPCPVIVRYAWGAIEVAQVVAEATQIAWTIPANHDQNSDVADKCNLVRDGVSGMGCSEADLNLLSSMPFMNCFSATILMGALNGKLTNLFSFTLADLNQLVPSSITTKLGTLHDFLNLETLFTENMLPADEASNIESNVEMFEESDKNFLQPTDRMQFIPMSSFDPNYESNKRTYSQLLHTNIDNDNLDFKQHLPSQLVRENYQLGVQRNEPHNILQQEEADEPFESPFQYYPDPYYPPTQSDLLVSNEHDVNYQRFEPQEGQEGDNYPYWYDETMGDSKALSTQPIYCPPPMVYHPNAIEAINHQGDDFSTQPFHTEIEYRNCPPMLNHATSGSEIDHGPVHTRNRGKREKLGFRFDSSNQRSGQTKLFWAPRNNRK